MCVLACGCVCAIDVARKMLDVETGNAICHVSCVSLASSPHRNRRRREFLGILAVFTSTCTRVCANAIRPTADRHT